MKLSGSLHRLFHFLCAFKRPLTSIEKFKIIETGADYLCRVDTGALVCAIHAEDVKIDETLKTVSFKHNGKLYVEPLLRMKIARSALGAMIRPRILWTYEWNGKQYKNIETALANRSKLRFKALIGRNLLKQIGLPIYISDHEVED